ncbi:hypothetical protein ACWKWP_05880 [Agromyces soli]
MHITLVDERDASWEQAEPRFRLFVYRGADNAVTAYDIVDASLDDVLEAARNLSEFDARLWSLAVVVDRADLERGLAWISGGDYNEAPTTPQEWRRRREMQSRYLMARSRRSAAPLLPDGRRLIRMFPEWISGWPLWEDFTDDYRLTGELLGLDPELSQALFDWNEAFLSRSEDDPVPVGWVDAGWELATRLQHAVAGFAEVRPEFGRYGQ